MPSGATSRHVASGNGCGSTVPSHSTVLSALPPSTPSSRADRAVPLPDHLGDELGASLGIPGITAHRTVFADGPVDGKTVLVHGVLGGVGSMAAQLARWGEADVMIGTVRSARRPRARRRRPLARAPSPWTATIRQQPSARTHRTAWTGSSRSPLSDNADLDDAVAANDAIIAAYATRSARTEIPFWTLLFNNVTLRLLGSDDFPDQARRQAAPRAPDRRCRRRRADRRGRGPVSRWRRSPRPMIGVDAGGRGRVHWSLIPR